MSGIITQISTVIGTSSNESLAISLASILQLSQVTNELSESVIALETSAFTDSQINTDGDDASDSDDTASIYTESEEYELPRHIIAIIFQLAGVDYMIQYIPH